MMNASYKQIPAECNLAKTLKSTGRVCSYQTSTVETDLVFTLALRPDQAQSGIWHSLR